MDLISVAWITSIVSFWIEFELMQILGCLMIVLFLLGFYVNIVVVE